MIEDSLASVRDLVDRWRRASAAASLDEVGAAARVRDARRDLGSGHPRDALGESLERGRCTAAEHATLVEHFADAAAEEVRTRAGVLAPRVIAEVRTSAGPMRLAELMARSFDGVRVAGLDERPLWLLGAEMERAGADSFDAEQEARERAGRVRARAEADVDAHHTEKRSALGELGQGCAELADTTLRQTDEAYEELLERTAHALGIPRPTDAAQLAQLLGARSLANFADPTRRTRRLGARLEALGLHRELSSRVRVAEPRGSVAWGARVVGVDPPHRVVIRPPAFEVGLASELALARAIGVALAHTLVNPALPVEFRRPVHGSVARAIGRLVAGLGVEPEVLGTYGSDEKAREALRTLSSLLLLIDMRRLAAAVCAGLETQASRRAAAAEEWGARACRVEGVPGALIAGSAFELESARYAELRAAVMAMALHAALRERYDEDWWRNPRAAEALRAGAARGGSLSVEGWAAELGANVDMSWQRWRELAS